MNNQNFANILSFVSIIGLGNKVPYGDRSNSIIEPFLTEQWFVNAKLKETDIVRFKDIYGRVK